MWPVVDLQNDITTRVSSHDGDLFSVFVSSEQAVQSTPKHYSFRQYGCSDHYVHYTRSDFEDSMVTWALYVLGSKNLDRQTEDHTIDMMLYIVRSWTEFAGVEWYGAHLQDVKTYLPLHVLLNKALEATQTRFDEPAAQAIILCNSTQELVQRLCVEAAWAICANEAGVHVDVGPRFYALLDT
jgi:hypothetical protein